MSIDITPADLAPAGVDLDEPRDWYFTFGFGHRIYARHRSDAEHGAPVVGEGVPVDGYYVMIRGTFYGARVRMCELFGVTWSFQYHELPSLADIGTEWHELIKIPEPNCPPL